jgi:hypothetical protein
MNGPVLAAVMLAGLTLAVGWLNAQALRNRDLAGTGGVEAYANGETRRPQ